MPNRPANPLPEGTDAVIAGASGETFKPAIPLDGADGAGDAETLPARAAAAASNFRDQAAERTADLRGQAGDKAREFAEQGKEKASTALEGVAKLIGDAAGQVDDKVGAEYGDYARRAAEAVDGLASTLRDKDIDALFADARDMVKKSPAIAIGAAAVLGFALVRLVKAGMQDGETKTAATSKPAKTASKSGGRKKA